MQEDYVNEEKENLSFLKKVHEFRENYFFYRI